MGERPKIIVLASALALFGAIFTLAIIVIGLDLGAEGLLTKMAFCLLTLTLFLAVAGSLNKDGPWTWSFLIFVEALCAAVPLLGYAFGAIDALSSIFLVAIAVFMIMLTASGQGKRWVEADRI